MGADKTPAAITVSTVLRIFAVFQQGAVVVPEDELRGVGSLLIGKQTRKQSTVSPLVGAAKFDQAVNPPLALLR